MRHDLQQLMTPCESERCLDCCPLPSPTPAAPLESATRGVGREKPFTHTTSVQHHSHFSALAVFRNKNGATLSFAQPANSITSARIMCISRVKSRVLESWIEIWDASGSPGTHDHAKGDPGSSWDGQGASSTPRSQTKLSTAPSSGPRPKPWDAMSLLSVRRTASPRASQKKSPGGGPYIRDPRSEEFHSDGSQRIATEKIVKMLTAHNPRHVMLRRADDLLREPTSEQGYHTM